MSILLRVIRHLGQTSVLLLGGLLSNQSHGSVLKGVWNSLYMVIVCLPHFPTVGRAGFATACVLHDNCRATSYVHHETICSTDDCHGVFDGGWLWPGGYGHAGARKRFYP